MLQSKFTESLGMIFAVMAYFSFSLLDAVQKTAIIYHSVFQLLFIKYCFVLFLSLIESQRKKLLILQIRNIKIQILRSVLSIIESGMFYFIFSIFELLQMHTVYSPSYSSFGRSFISYYTKRVCISKNMDCYFCWFCWGVDNYEVGLSLFDSKSIPLLELFS